MNKTDNKNVVLVLVICFFIIAGLKGINYFNIRYFNNTELEVNIKQSNIEYLSKDKYLDLLSKVYSIPIADAIIFDKNNAKNIESMQNIEKYFYAKVSTVYNVCKGIKIKLSAPVKIYSNDRNKDNKKFVWIGSVSVETLNNIYKNYEFKPFAVVGELSKCNSNRPILSTRGVISISKEGARRLRLSSEGLKKLGFKCNYGNVYYKTIEIFSNSKDF
ncbi:hypothetical protein [Clostridium botulinum]|uniref:hypothetical protein n=1 Tax=Clostridium botulinum TaxID=1491 RepID=UPI0004D8F335|nr:hypothetical protein [Clostridium botulinum]KEH97436.1 hypothetical protein Z953_02025 [Clostridium botulinum D str. 16868]